MSTSTKNDPRVFHPDRTMYLVAIVMGMMILAAASWNMMVLGWFLIIPVLMAYWTARSATTVTDNGLKASYAFRKPEAMKWEELAGIRFQGTKALAVSHEGTEIYLPGVTFNSLSRLNEVSQGRIPDVIEEGRRAAAEKITIIYRDGREVLMDRDEAIAQGLYKPEESGE